MILNILNGTLLDTASFELVGERPLTIEADRIIEVRDPRPRRLTERRSPCPPFANAGLLTPCASKTTFNRPSPP